jgi:hypothetical protein
MASPNLSEIVSTTLRHRAPEVANNVLRNNALLMYLNERGNSRPFSGGRTITQPLTYAQNSTYKRYSGYEVLNISPSETITSAEFPIRQAAVAISISGLEMLQNSGREAVIDLLRTRLSNAEDTIKNGLSYDIYSDGTATGQINGLQSLISTAPTSGTIGGIDRATWTFWQNLEYSAVTDGGAAATSANIQRYMNALAVQMVRGNDGFDLIVADNNYYTLYLESMQAIQRVTDEKTAGAGFASLKYYASGRSVNVILDGGFQGYSSDTNPTTGGAPANKMYFVNTKYLHWRPHRDRNMVPINPDRYSVNQDAMVQLIGWAGNLTLSNARLQGVLTA